MECEMCGSEEQLFKTEIEGTQLNVCKKCAKYGEIIMPIKKERPLLKNKAIVREEPEIEEVIVKNYPKIIKEKREELGLKQEDLAKKINEKVSVIHHLEIGKTEPNMALAKKLERFLNVNLIEDIELDYNHKKESSENNGVTTIGDLIKLRQKS